MPAEFLGIMASNTMLNGQAKPEAPKSFADAQPTLTHFALKHLADDNNIDYIITQNVDGLHQRAGLSRSKLAILHGCVFETKCEQCGKLYFEEAEVDTISFKPTGRLCTAVMKSNDSIHHKISNDDGDALIMNASVSSGPPNKLIGSVCGGIVRDTLLDWEDPLPDSELEMSQHACANADLVVALGTSLRMSLQAVFTPVQIEPEPWYKRPLRHS